MNLKIRAPFFFIEDFPEAEQRPVHYIISNISSAIAIVDHFQHSLELFIEARARREVARKSLHAITHTQDRRQSEDLELLSKKMKSWIEMSARQGAMLAYSCEQLRQKDSSLFPLCPTFYSGVDKALLKESRIIFQKAFPSIAKVRLPAAHPFEHGSSPKDVDSHAAQDLIEFPIHDEYLGLPMIDSKISVCGEELQYHSTVKGQLVGYTLSKNTLKMLFESVRTYALAFGQLDHSACE
ncbi:hypothetical protein [Sphingomonas sp. NPDC079357]|uniref:hypothetical protein n=1 Tax=Sphingomonas sp. NPDC079357 TaxID=3364518 RepID=UPI00384A8554